MTDQHTRWAARAERREAWADAAEAKAATLVANHSTDWAFVSQPGHIPARARQIAQTDRAMDLLNQAAAHRAKAANLAAIANRKKGDAEAARQAERDASTLKVGDAARSIHFGPCVIVKVNAKTCRIRLPSGFETTQDKAWVK